ncbi:MAG: hypothetical protein QM401_00755 [Bacillota bacterium]|nr:hypothetical protein [Bacillota bacterium]
MAGPLWQELPDKMTQVSRAQFLRDEQGAEKTIYELLDEFDAKLTAIFARHAQGADGVIPVSAKGKVELEIRNTSIWFASELETLIREGAEVAAEQGIEAERKSQLLYVKKVLEELPEKDGKRVMGLVTDLQKGAGDRK